MCGKGKERNQATHANQAYRVVPRLGFWGPTVASASRRMIWYAVKEHKCRQRCAYTVASDVLVRRTMEEVSTDVVTYPQKTNLVYYQLTTVRLVVV